MCWMEKGKTLFVLGASSDIGCGLIEAVADRYDTILGHYCHGNDRLDDLSRRLGGRLTLLQADFSDMDSVARMTDHIKEQGWKPDHIVHFSAPRCRNVKFIKCGWDDFGAGLDTSLEAPVRILQAFLPDMVKQKYGKIIFMLTAYVDGKPPKFMSPYVTVKYALLGLMRSLAAEYADKGITVNGVSPEMMETKFLQDIPELVIRQNAAGSPLGRNLTVHDVIPAFSYLLSEAADCVTGQNLVITGGK